MTKIELMLLKTAYNLCDKHIQMLTDDPDCEGSDEEVKLAVKISKMIEFAGIDLESDHRFEKAGGLEIPKLNQKIIGKHLTFNFIEDEQVISADTVAQLIYNQFSSTKEIDKFLEEVGHCVLAYAAHG